MKRSTRRSVALALCIAMLGNSMPAFAATIKMGGLPTNVVAPVSDRLIVKLKPNYLPSGLSVAQINSNLSQPLSANVMAQLQTVAGVAMAEVRSISNGAHVLSVAGRPNRQMLDRAIAAISRLPNIAYVEEDAIDMIQAVPNDGFYTVAASYPGLWGLWPTVPVAASAPGGTGNYGADFQTAWDTVTGTGVVVAVVDTGITPNFDIAGPNGVVAAGTGSNLVSVGYDFITDCRYRGTCLVTTTTAGAYVAPKVNATDLGDYLSSTDCSNPSSYFYGRTPSNSSWHGTHVAGTIAAIGNNNLGVIGGAYNAKILPVRVLGKGGGLVSDIADGIMWAAGVHSTIPNPNPAKVINLSLGGTGLCTATYQNAINAAVAAGAVVVVAAGNSNMDVANARPANCANVITVAAIGRDGARASYSNFSSPASNVTNPTNVTLAAQGGDQNLGMPSFDPGILSTLNDGTTTATLYGRDIYAWYHGTSMATPHVSAAAALMLAKNPSLTPAQVKTILSAPSSLTAFPTFAAGSIPVLNNRDCSVGLNCGAGILNANLALLNTPYRELVGAATAEFGSIVAGSGSVNKTITLTNSSQVSVVQSGAITVTGANSTLFAISADTCTTATIAANGTCQFTMSYTPSAVGVHTATLTVPISGASAPTLVTLNGSAGTTVLATTTPNMTAATVAVGQSTTVNLSFNNPNAVAMKAGAVILSNPTIMAASSDACSNATIGAGASCAVTVTVSPAVAGAYTGTASLSLSGGGAAAVATIDGTANPAPVPPPSSGGGGGCSMMPLGADPDASLLLALLAVGMYWLRRRKVNGCSAD